MGRKAVALKGVQWHFDIRYITYDPIPGHVLFLVRLDAKEKYVERLPVGIEGNDDRGLSFFPETGAEAAPEMAKALLYCFKNKVEGKSEDNLMPPSFKLATDDATLARAVEKELGKLGVPSSQCKVEVEKSDMRVLFAQIQFEDAYRGFKAKWGISAQEARMGEDVPSPPEAIGFSNFKPPSDFAASSGAEKGLEDVQAMLDYVQALLNASPMSDERLLNMENEVMKVRLLFMEKPAGIRKREADDGDGGAAMDYGLRLYFGAGVAPSRRLSRKYLIQAALDASVLDSTRSIAHALLTSWYTACQNDFRTRYLFAAAHHANEAMRLTLGRVPPPAVLFFGKNLLECEADRGTRGLRSQFKHVWKAVAKREGEMEAERNAARLKRLTKPNRYRCATVGCGIEASSGKMLLRCAGKCDPDKKPSYCSKECQKADWKNHKPFCIPGAACSVIDDSSNSSNMGGYKSAGAIGVPVQNADGTSTFVSSTTMSASELREFRDVADGKAKAGNGVPSNIQMERWEI
ncbi:hypothetical protein VKT23_004853 [Stygiomarasmius scandens]|uniref:MYND-type domain-containing protein n=1 Tax=Marasmiellus scandens TaxID=2682957 RepID=A0ABR1JU06_9AGAR